MSLKHWEENTHSSTILGPASITGSSIYLSSLQRPSRLWDTMGTIALTPPLPIAKAERDSAGSKGNHSPRFKMLELCLHSPILLHSIAMNLSKQCIILLWRFRHTIYTGFVPLRNCKQVWALIQAMVKTWSLLSTVWVTLFNTPRLNCTCYLIILTV
jgi:hypothetical protein